MVSPEHQELFVTHTIMGERSGEDEHFSVPLSEIETVTDPGLRRALTIQADLAARGGMAAFVQSRRTADGGIEHAGTTYIGRRESTDRDA